MAYEFNYDEMLVSSNNSINDNKINTKKAAQSTTHQLKQLLRPILTLLKRRRRNTYKKAHIQPDEFDVEVQDNQANEMLEARLFEEIDECDDFAAVPVYSEGHMDILQVFRGQRYIPVNFARTEAGTFFWTSIMGPDWDVSSVGDKDPITEHQSPEIQVASDRWAQA